MSCQIKAIYNAIETFRGTSGNTWDYNLGANIDTTSATIWDNYVAVKVSVLYV
jgi:hypothetical protein